MVRREITIQCNGSTIYGDLVVPDRAKGLVIFAHGSGSGRFSTRNTFVSNILNEARIATLLIDLLTEEEEQIDRYTAEIRFDIGLLADRVRCASEWVRNDPELMGLPLGYFGASTGAAAALSAAVNEPEAPKAIVSRGGRPDLAGSALDKVQSATLLIVGSRDQAVLHLNRDALERIPAKEKKLVLVEGASHLFEEPGTLEQVANLASDWFSTQFSPVKARATR